MSRMRAACIGAVRVIGWASASLALAACFGRDGDSIERTQRYAAADGTFQLTYAAPPWELARNGYDTARLEIGLEFFGIEIGGALPPSHIVLAAKIDLETSLEDIISIEEIKKIASDNGIELNDDDFPSSIPDNFETGSEGFATGEDFDDLGGTEETGSDLEDIVDYLHGIDVENPRDVAVAEMGYLMDNQDAELVTGLRRFQTSTGHVGVEYQMYVPPGVNIRNYYLKTSEQALRISFLSIFALDTPDIDMMVDAIQTDAEPEAPPYAGNDETADGGGR